MTFLETFPKILSWSKNENLSDDQHIIRHCRIDEEQGEIGLDAFKLRKKDIEEAHKKKKKPCISTQWWEYWQKNIDKVIRALQKCKIEINERSRLCCVSVSRIKSIGKECDMDIDVIHTGKGHTGIFNVRKDEYKFKRDMMLEARKNILEIPKKDR